jgi:hypothetical protein
MSAFQRLDSNCRPRSVTMVEGTPKRATHPLMKVRATASAVMESLWPPCESVHTREKIRVTVGGRERSNEVDMDSVESRIRRRKR